jgi:hypothetical protein
MFMFLPRDCGRKKLGATAHRVQVFQRAHSLSEAVVAWKLITTYMPEVRFFNLYYKNQIDIHGFGRGASRAMKSFRRGV